MNHMNNIANNGLAARLLLLKSMQMYEGTSTKSHDSLIIFPKVSFTSRKILVPISVLA
ncbi:hypothetical protein NTGM5_10011 [Candidatus Nitrotoga sp. M5]|nr:hypothetical protein NTGM5_10011 [Candidatus Nitrotoga sp. M5]